MYNLPNHEKKSTIEIRREIKLGIGLPIFLDNVRTKDEQIASEQTKWILDKIDFWNRGYSMQLKMLDPLCITSIMTPRQHNLLLEQMQAHYLPGLILESR